MNYVKETIFIIALAAAAVSCAKDSTPVNDPAGEKVFTAGISTKTELVGGNAVHWVANDKISLFDGVANREFETADAGTTASFSGTASDAATYYALYPYQSGASFAEGVITATLPSAQNAVPGSFADRLNLSAAKTDDSHLLFKNVCGLVAVDLQRYFEVTSIKLEGRNNEDLAGTLSISFDADGNPVVNSISGASKSITLSNGGAVLGEGVYYFVVAPGTYSNGFKITLTDNSSRTKEIEKTTSVPLSRAKLKKYTLRNPYWFTRVVWGNNLGLTPAYQYANQFRAKVYTDLKNLGSITPKLFDEKGDEVVKVSLSLSTADLPRHYNYGALRATGNLDFSSVTEIAPARVNCVGFVSARVTNGTGLGATTVIEPVFLSYPAENYPVTFTPFVVMANPKTGGVYETNPTLNGVTAEDFLLDWREGFQYYNLGGPVTHVDGAPSTAGSFLNTLWTTYFTAIGKAVNTGAKQPAAYYGSTDSQRAETIAYIRPGDYNVVVGAEKWIVGGKYANGVFRGQVSYVTNGVEADINSSNRGTMPLWIWFDERF